jgi:hypothetical protein
MNNRNNEELSDREISALLRENTGGAYKRAGYISDLAIEAHIEASLRPVETCDFRNDYGWCKLDKGHGGSHTVIFLGKDD